MIEYTHYYKLHSAAFRGAWYNAKSSRLYLEFTNGTLSAYSGFSPSDWQSFINTSSAGRYYAAHIKSKFSGIPVDQDSTFVEATPDSEKAVGVLAKTTFIVKATLSAFVEMDVEADDIVGAMEAFNKQLKEKGLETVNVEFGSVVKQ